MQTVLEILNKTTEFFRKRGVPDPRLDAQYILAKGLGLTRMDLYLKFDRPVTDAELAAMRPWVQRRGNREPLQHVLGITSFRGHELKCDRRALIPRPETETLVDLVLAALKGKENPLVLDVGTGTGAIAIAIALEHPTAIVHAVDISADAIALSGDNVQTHKLQARVFLHRSDLLASLPEGLTFDLIASNPPYIPSAVIQTLQPEVRDHDPKLALDGGADGLELPRKLVSQGSLRLNSHGRMFLELGEGQAQSLAQHGTLDCGLASSRVHPDLAGVERFLEFYR